MAITKPQAIVTALALMITTVSGCGSKADGHAVSGSVTWPGGSLSGHHVEVVNANDPNQRGFGIITDAGKFELGQLKDGKFVPRLSPGQYQARLVINDEGDGKTKKPNVPKRFLDFKTSGWTVPVPPTAEPTLVVAAK